MATWSILILLLAVTYVSACLSSSSNKDFEHDLEYKTDLTNLFNLRVVKAERYERPLAIGVSNTIASALRLLHSGVVVTLADGRRFLVQKGNEYGIASQTVVVDARYMSSVWRRTAEKTVNSAIVADYVRVGGVFYNLFWDNCHHASARMMGLL